MVGAKEGMVDKYVPDAPVYLPVPAWWLLLRRVRAISPKLNAALKVTLQSPNGKA